MGWWGIGCGGGCWGFGVFFCGIRGECVLIYSSSFFSFSEEEKRSKKEELFWKSWVFRLLRKSTMGRCPLDPYKPLKRLELNFFTDSVL